MENAQNIITWILGSILISIVSLIAGIFSIYRSGKIIPKEVKGMELDNQMKEANIADKYKAMLETEVKINLDLRKINNQLLERLDKIESGQQVLEARIEMQKEDIARLRCELDNARMYNTALIHQMEKAGVIPIKMEDLPLADCTGDDKKRTIKKNKIKDSKNGE